MLAFNRDARFIFKFKTTFYLSLLSFSLLIQFSRANANEFLKEEVKESRGCVLPFFSKNTPINKNEWIEKKADANWNELSNQIKALYYTLRHTHRDSLISKDQKPNDPQFDPLTFQQLFLSEAQKHQVISHLVSQISESNRLTNSRGIKASEIWGESLNFDEFVKKEIIGLEVASLLQAMTGKDFSNRKVHAGYEHTYGYLLSTLETDYGFKRWRWTLGSMSQGLGLNRQWIHPLPDKSYGTLLDNITAIFSALTQEKKSKPYKHLFLNSTLGKNVLAKKALDTARKKRHLVIETITLPSGNKIQIETWIVPLLPLPAGDSNAFALFHLYRDLPQGFQPKLDQLPDPKFITSFPVGLGFVDILANLEKPDKYRLQYNMYHADLIDIPSGTLPSTHGRKIQFFKVENEQWTEQSSQTWTAQAKGE